MSLVVDPDSSFYEHLTLGVPRTLEKIRGVQDVELEKRMPCERVLLSSWEQRHCCTLPEDMKNFYLSTDGFRLTWNFEYAGEVVSIGNMRINAISELRRLAGLKNFGDAENPNLLDIEICIQGISSDNNIQKPNFGTKCKIFELDPLLDIGKVCLVYIDKTDGESDLKREDPKIWLMDRSFDWHFLAPNFTQYFRMMLLHLGLPQWQLLYTPMGLTPWAEQMFAMIAPQLLQPHVQKSREVDWSDAECNKIDPSIFKTHKRGAKKKLDNSK